MKLILENGYPYPLPEEFNTDEHDALSHQLTVDGVTHFEWKYELTIEFKDYSTALRAKEATGWPWYDEASNILSAPFSAVDGYEAPAIIVKDMAYCGFILVEMKWK